MGSWGRGDEKTDDVAQETVHGDVLKRGSERGEAELGGDAGFQGTDGIQLA